MDEAQSNAVDEAVERVRLALLDLFSRAPADDWYSEFWPMDEVAEVAVAAYREFVA